MREGERLERARGTGKERGGGGSSRASSPPSPVGLLPLEREREKARGSTRHLSLPRGPSEPSTARKQEKKSPFPFPLNCRPPKKKNSKTQKNPKLKNQNSIAAGRPIPVPGSGLQVTQLGHVKDLSDAFRLCLGNPKAFKQIYNISGERLVTFDGIARACAEAAGAPEPELVHFDAKDFDFGKKKAFPMRDQHFFTSVTKAREELGWEPKFGLVDGLRDSYAKDFGRGQFRKAADFETDDLVLAKVKGLVKA